MLENTDVEPSSQRGTLVETADGLQALPCKILDHLQKPNV